MAYSSIVKPTDYFNTVLYTGNGSTQSITGVGFQPDWIWQKERSSTSYHIATDSVRGLTKQLFPNDPYQDATASNYITSFDSDGFGLGASNDINQSSETYAAWNWLAGGSTSSNSNGSITSTVSANTTAGFSIVSYTGTGSNATVGHGLGSVPKMFIVKDRTSGENWRVYHASLGNTKEIYLDLPNASVTSSTTWNNTTPTSSVFSVGTVHGTNKSSDNYIAYCFAEIKGYSKFGSYTANANADGPFVYTGFKPAWILLKASNNGSWSWRFSDSTRTTFNSSTFNNLFPSSSAAEVSNEKDLDYLSNGFKLRTSGSGVNNSGYNVIYMAFAQNPFVANNSGTAVPVVAR